MQTLIILIMMMITKNAEARPVSLNVVRVDNVYYSNELAEQSINRAIRSIRKEMGIKIFIRTTSEIREYCESKGDGITTQERVNRLFCYRNLAVFDNDIPTIFIVPPITNDAGRYIAGYASSQCYKLDKRPTAYAAVEEQNNIGDDRRRHSLVVIKHELGHLLGATHDDQGISVMHYNPLPLVEQSTDLRFSIKSIKEIYKCIG